MWSRIWQPEWQQSTAFIYTNENEFLSVCSFPCLSVTSSGENSWTDFHHIPLNSSSPPQYIPLGPNPTKSLNNYHHPHPATLSPKSSHQPTNSMFCRAAYLPSPRQTLPPPPSAPSFLLHSSFIPPFLLLSLIGQHSLECFLRALPKGSSSFFPSPTPGHFFFLPPPPQVTFYFAPLASQVAFFPQQLPDHTAARSLPELSIQDDHPTLCQVSQPQ